MSYFNQKKEDDIQRGSYRLDSRSGSRFGAEPVAVIFFYYYL